MTVLQIDQNPCLPGAGKYYAGPVSAVSQFRIRVSMIAGVGLEGRYHYGVVVTSQQNRQAGRQSWWMRGCSLLLVPTGFHVFHTYVDCV